MAEEPAARLRTMQIQMEIVALVVTPFTTRNLFDLGVIRLCLYIVYVRLALAWRLRYILL